MDYSHFHYFFGDIQAIAQTFSHVFFLFAFILEVQEWCCNVILSPLRFAQLLYVLGEKWK